MNLVDKTNILESLKQLIEDIEVSERPEFVYRVMVKNQEGEKYSWTFSTFDKAKKYCNNGVQKAKDELTRAPRYGFCKIYHHAIDDRLWAVECFDTENNRTHILYEIHKDEVSE